MSRIENITIKIKNAKIDKIEKLCLYFSEDFTAVQTSEKLGISRQTVNHYYKILRDKLHTQFMFIDSYISKQILHSDHLHIKYLNIYEYDIFYIELEGKFFILNKTEHIPMIQKSLITSLSKHKKANCARVLIKKDNSFLVSCFLKKEDYFKSFLENRLKKFRGINKDRLDSYLLESQIRHNFSSKDIYQKLLLSFK